MTAHLQTRFVIKAFLLAAILWSAPSLAVKLEGDAAGAYTRYCSADTRAVWVETFDSGSAHGYSRLICLEESTQALTYWWITPSKQVIADNQFPSGVEQPADMFSKALAAILYSPEHPINVDRTSTVPVLLTFKINKPDFPDLGYDYASTGSASTSSDGTTTSSATYFVEGQQVDQATYLAYESDARAAEQQQRAEIDSLIRLDAETKLYELVDLNDWHDWMDVLEVNGNQAPNACWLYTDSLLLDLTRAQIKRLAGSSKALVSIEAYAVGTDDGGPDSSPNTTSAEVECKKVNAALSESPSGNGVNDGTTSSPTLGDGANADGVTESADSDNGLQFDDGESVNDVIASTASKSGSVNEALLLILLGVLLLKVAARKPQLIRIKAKKSDNP